MPLLKYTVYLFSLSGVMKSLKCFKRRSYYVISSISEPLSLPDGSYFAVL